MNTNQTNSLAEGKPMGQILRFAMPLLGGLLFQQFYNVVDTMIVGRYLGAAALAGVGATGSLNFLVMGFCIGVCSGFSVPLSQKFGAKDEPEMRRLFAHSVYLAAAMAVVITTLIGIFCRRILILTNIPAEIMPYAYDYIFILFMGIPVTFACNVLAGAIRAVGDSRTPVILMILSTFINILLDILLIKPLGVAGASIATVIAQVVSLLLSGAYVLRYLKLMVPSGAEWKFSWHYIRILLVMGVPMGLQYTVTAIGSVILQTAVNGLGTSYIAAQVAGGKVSNFLCTPMDALGSTMAVYAGQNVGAGQLKRLKEGLKAAGFLGSLYSCAAMAVLILWGRELTSIFLTGDSGEIAGFGAQFLIWNAAFYILLLFVNVVRFTIQGMGYAGVAIISGALEMAARTGVAFLLIPRLGYTGACMANPAAWILADLFLFPTYFHLQKKLEMRFQKAKVE